MEEVKLEIPFTEIHGAIESQGIIYHQLNAENEARNAPQADKNA